MTALNLTDRYANELLHYARERKQLAYFYTLALIITQRTQLSNVSDIPEPLHSWLRQIPPEKIYAVLSKFTDISRTHLGLLDVTVVSAVPLSDKQRTLIADKLAQAYNRQINMVERVDPSLIGGLRIIAGHTVIDNSIKKKLTELKKNIYQRVYFR